MRGWKNTAYLDGAILIVEYSDSFFSQFNKERE